MFKRSTSVTDEDHPRMKAYKALLSVSDLYRDSD